MSREPPAWLSMLPHRTSRLSGSRVMQILDWMTRTWMRFNLFMSWVVFLFLVMASSLPISEKVVLLLMSPIGAMATYGVCAAGIYALAFVPVVKVALGLLRIIYIRTFCRLVAQPIYVEMPTWF